MQLDRSALDELVATIGDDPDDLIDLISTFLEDGPKLVADLARARAEDDAEAARRAVHSLKSSARSFGAARLATLCEELEQRLRAGAGLAEVSGLAEEAAQAWGPCAEALAQEMRELEAGR